MILAIFFIHYYFYSELYVFNFSKALKDEFLDLYITKINDFKEELTSTIVKDIKIDIENQLFFQVYFKELATAGLMNEDKVFLIILVQPLYFLNLIILKIQMKFLILLKILY